MCEFSLSAVKTVQAVFLRTGGKETATVIYLLMKTLKCAGEKTCLKSGCTSALI